MQNLQTPNSLSKSRKKIGLPKALTWTFLVIGAISLLVSILYVSSILAFIGLGLIFWGAILTYIQTEKYTKQAVLDAALTPSVDTINQIIQELDYKGKAVYLPPKYLKDPEESKIYISKKEDGKLLKPETALLHEEQIFLENPYGLLLNPPGTQLSKLFETKLDITFAKTDLKYFTQNMPRLLTDDLEIAENIEIEKENNKIKIRITDSSFNKAYEENKKLLNPYPSLSNPLSSAIACALTKVTGKPITIEKIQISEEGKNLEATYEILEKTKTEIYPPETKPKVTTEKPPTETLTKEILTEPVPQQIRNFSPYLTSLLLTAIGSIILAQVAWIIYYDMTIWGKDVTQIFLGSRTGQTISFGIGLTLIHYLILGIATFLSGTILYILRRSKA
jgi:hypothetical protein